MNKSDLIEEVARVAGLTHEQSETIVTAVFERIVQALVTGGARGGARAGHVRGSPASPPHGAEPEDRCDRPGSGPESPVLQDGGKELRAILNPEPVPEKAHAWPP